MTGGVLWVLSLPMVVVLLLMSLLLLPAAATAWAKPEASRQEPTNAMRLHQRVRQQAASR